MTMTTRTADRLDDWDSRPFTEGYEGLRALSDQSFSGVVTAGRAKLCLLNGTVVGILDGTIEDFQNATGTIHKAPTPVLPLLLLMQDRGDEVRAKYYSEETPLSEADQKLSDGGFTGYIELSENVLSGDYYVVYQGGKSMSAAFVGESERLITGDEAFEQADDEVGIYKVRQVDIDVVEIPEPADDDETGAATAGRSESEQSSPEPGAEAEDSPETESASDGSETTEDQQRTETNAAGGRSGAESPLEPTHVSGTSRQQPREDASQPESPQPRSGRDQQNAQRETAPPQSGTGPDSRESEQPPARREPPTEGSRDDRQQPGQRQPEPARERSDRSTREDNRAGETSDERRRSDRDSTRPSNAGRESSRQRDTQEQRRELGTGADQGAAGSKGGTTTEEPGELERRSIPSVDPDRSWITDGSDEKSAATGFSTSREDTTSGHAKSTDAYGGRDERAGQQRNERSSQQQGTRQGSGAPAGVAADLEEAETEIANLTRRIEDLEAERDDIQAERDQLQTELSELETELESVRGERNELQEEVEKLRETVSTLETRLDQAGEETVSAETTLTPREAVDGTNLFVRYKSKGEATLKSAHNGSASAEEVNENLSLEYHTQFDSDSTAVEGQTYDEFLVGTIHYRFVSWLIRKLLYEIRDTGHQDALADLYDALPRIDRVELNGTITVEYTEDGQEQRDQVNFDIVVRDRMGNPLAVANINEDRAAATEEMMTDLVTTARRVGESNERLAGGFFVTSSFYDPDALDTADEATGGGLLSRDKRQSYVKLSRKDGFHLCLVESRDGDFHLAVPEL